MSAKKIVVYLSVFSAGALAVLGGLALGGVFPGQAAVLVAPTNAVSGTPATEKTKSGVTAIGDLVRNTFVTVEGTVERVTDEDEFFIADTTGSVKVWTGSPFGVVNPGEKITVRGFVDDDLFLEIYAQEIITGDGTVVELRSYGG